MEVLEDGSDVVSGAGVGEEEGSRVLDMLEFIEEVGWDAREHRSVTGGPRCGPTYTDPDL